MYSINGCDWFNQFDQKLDLPLEEDSSLTKVYSSDRNIYLKDIDVEEKPLLLYVESDSADPTEGSRELYLYKLGEGSEFVSAINHNYSTGFYQDGYIITPVTGTWGFAGGDLSLLMKKDTWVSVSVQQGAYNYARKVHNSNSIGFVSQEIDKSGKMIKLNF